jgi:hypothetical protein
LVERAEDQDEGPMTPLQAGLAAGPLSMLQALRELMAEEPDPEIAAALEQLVGQMRDGTIDADRFVTELKQFRNIEGAAGEAVRRLTDDLVKQAIEVQRLTEELRKAGQAGALLGTGATFLPESVAAAATSSRVLSGRSEERSSGRPWRHSGRHGTCARQHVRHLLEPLLAAAF